MRSFPLTRPPPTLLETHLGDVTLLWRLWLLYFQSSLVGSMFTAVGRGLRSGPHKIAAPSESWNLEGMSSMSVYTSDDMLPVHTKLRIN